MAKTTNMDKADVRLTNAKADFFTAMAFFMHTAAVAMQDHLDQKFKVVEPDVREQNSVQDAA